jgi:hypothetical protein
MVLPNCSVNKAKASESSICSKGPRIPEQSIIGNVPFTGDIFTDDACSSSEEDEGIIHTNLISAEGEDKKVESEDETRLNSCNSNHLA